MPFYAEQSAEKLRGGYYTEPTIAQWLLRWVRGIAPITLLEPSCGDGAFFAPLASAVPMPSLRHVLAGEQEPGEAEKAAAVLAALPGVQATFLPGDFLGWAVARLGQPPEVDAAVGNPPFVRYQFLDDAQQRRAEQLLRGLGLRFTRHTNAWVPFVVAAMDRLRPGGRLAMVVPAELLHVLHAEAARAHLLRSCSRILVLDPEEIWFGDTLQGVVLLLAEKAVAPTVARLAVTRVSGRAFFEEDPETHFEHADYAAAPAGKWMPALLTATERQLLVALPPSVRRLGDVADVQVGIVTGANDFFLVPDAVVDAHALHDVAHPMFGRSEHVAGVVYDADTHEENRRRGLPTNFLHFADPLSDGAAAYVATGVAQGLHTRFKCRIRTPWYRVPSVFRSPIAMLKRSHDHPRLVLNTLGAYTTDTAYRLSPRGVDAPRLVHAFVNSLTALSAELEGRHYGGGVLELVPSEIVRLEVPLPDIAVGLGTLDAGLRAGTQAPDLLRMQDETLLSAAGFAPADQRVLHGAWRRLRDRRQRVETRTR